MISLYHKVWTRLLSVFSRAWKERVRLLLEGILGYDTARVEPWSLIQDRLVLECGK
jgi:hypothetical protein